MICSIVIGVRVQTCPVSGGYLIADSDKDVFPIEVQDYSAPFHSYSLDFVYQHEEPVAYGFQIGFVSEDTPLEYCCATTSIGMLKSVSEALRKNFGHISEAELIQVVEEF